MMINACESVAGQKYLTPSKIVVEIIEKRSNEVVVRSEETGHTVTIPPTYKLIPYIEAEVVKTELPIVAEEKAMDEQTPETPVATETPRKVKKSNIVDEGIKNNLSIDEIVKNVLAAFPEATEKSVRNLVSVRRSKMKKTTV
jgi:hypothetical protein